MRVLLLAVSVSALFVINGVAQEENLVLYLKFDEGEGDKVIDQSGKGNNGTINGKIERVEGKFGSALKFDGSSTYVEVPYSESLSLSKKFSFAVWVNHATAMVSARVIASQGLSWEFVTHGDQVTTRRYYVIFNENEQGNGFMPIRENRWMHLAFTWDGKTIKFYYNGKPDGEAFFNLALPDTQEPLRIGAGQHGENWLGLIDEVKLWNRALTDLEVERIMMPEAIEASGKLTTTWGKIKTKEVEQ